ncbi:transposase [Microbacterium binotii]|uniref:Transposase n=1 Tax=Microbacterium binotii TaxID=462710 RepID=A0ABN3P6W9_9MICO
MNRKYSPEMRERALRMLAETRPSHPTMMSAVRHVAGLLGMSPETLRLWQHEVDAGVKPGLTTDAAAEIKRLQKENAELRKANEMADSSGGRNEFCELLRWWEPDPVSRTPELRRCSSRKESVRCLLPTRRSSGVEPWISLRRETLSATLPVILGSVSRVCGTG